MSGTSYEGFKNYKTIKNVDNNEDIKYNRQQLYDKELPVNFGKTFFGNLESIAEEGI